MNTKIKIGNRTVGEGEKIFIIAELGSNHNRKIKQAKELIDAAAESKTDAVKFQLFKAEKLYPSGGRMFDLIKENELPREWLGELVDYARRKKILLLASPFDAEAVDLMIDLGIPAIKWASSEVFNLSFLRYAAKKNKPLIIATGMCDLADVCEAVEVVYSTGNKDLILLQCTSLYPTQAKDVNIRAMDVLRESFGLPVGFSDHTLGIASPIAAAARGACVIEKHFTLSRKLKGPDHAYALEPKELKCLVDSIREAEACLGSPFKKMLPEEKKTARKNSIIAKNNIRKGSVINKELIVAERPALGIAQRFLEVVIGQKAGKDIKKGSAITWDMLA